MIIYNGTMQAVVNTGGGFNNGYPVEQNRSLGDIIPVNITGNRRRENTTENSSYTSATYEVLCDVTDFDAEEIQLIDNRNHNLGIFRVLDTQYLDYVDAVKIIAERYGDD